MTALKDQHCRHQSGAAMTDDETARHLAEVPGWTVDDGALCKRYDFTDFHQTMAFVNAVAWIAHQQDHHPQMQVGYNHCLLRWNTHSVGGLSVNDFIAAARVDALRG